MKGAGRIFRRKKKRPDGSTFEIPVWWIAYYFRGKEYRESSHSTSETTARRKLKKRLGEIGSGKLIGPIEEKVTFEQMADDLTRDYEINGKKSLASIKLSISHLKEAFALGRAIDITTDKVRIYIAERQSDGASNGSINRELSALKRMFTLAIQAGKLSSKPYIPMLEENNARQGFLDHGSFLSLKNALPEYLKDPVTFLYISGWRVSEMRKLERRDIDLAGKVVRLRPEISKNKKGRVLPIDDDLLEVVERAMGKTDLGCSNVFHDSGQPIGNFRKSWNTACVSIGLGKFVEVPGGEKKKKYVGTLVHDLRRTAVRNMVRAGIPEQVAMELSGHKTRNVFDRYNIVSEDDLKDAQKKLHDHLQKQPQEAKVAVMGPRKEK